MCQYSISPLTIQIFAWYVWFPQIVCRNDWASTKIDPLSTERTAPEHERSDGADWHARGKTDKMHRLRISAPAYVIITLQFLTYAKIRDHSRALSSVTCISGGANAYTHKPNARNKTEPKKIEWKQVIGEIENITALFRLFNAWLNATNEPKI